MTSNIPSGNSSSGSPHYSRENMGIAHKLLDYNDEQQRELSKILEDFITKDLSTGRDPTVAYVKATVEFSEALLETLSGLDEKELSEYRSMPIEWVFRIALTNVQSSEEGFDEDARRAHMISYAEAERKRDDFYG